MKNVQYTVITKGSFGGWATLMSIGDAFQESKKSLRETVVMENVLDGENKKVVSSREVILKVVAFVQCDNCEGTGATDTLGVCSCSICDGSGLVSA